MKYNLTRECGHETQENLVGPESDRKRKLEWLKSHPCATCQKAAIVEVAESAGLPTLAGSEKQVDWAMSIRTEIKAALDSIVESVAQKQPARLEEARAVVASILSNTEARFWIDNRNAVARDLFAAAAKARSA